MYVRRNFSLTTMTGFCCLGSLSSGQMSILLTKLGTSMTPKTPRSFATYRFFGRDDGKDGVKRSTRESVTCPSGVILFFPPDPLSGFRSKSLTATWEGMMMMMIWTLIENLSRDETHHRKTCIIVGMLENRSVRKKNTPLANSTYSKQRKKYP
jgi:hypothetical protein